MLLAMRLVQKDCCNNCSGLNHCPLGSIVFIFEQNWVLLVPFRIATVLLAMRLVQKDWCNNCFRFYHCHCHCRSIA